MKKIIIIVFVSLFITKVNAQVGKYNGDAVKKPNITLNDALHPKPKNTLTGIIWDSAHALGTGQILGGRDQAPGYNLSLYLYEVIDPNPGNSNNSTGLIKFYKLRNYTVGNLDDILVWRRDDISWNWQIGNLDKDKNYMVQLAQKIENHEYTGTEFHIGVKGGARLNRTKTITSSELRDCSPGSWINTGTFAGIYLYKTTAITTPR